MSPDFATSLGVDPALAVPGFEDVWYHLWKERRLPVNVDPLQNKLADAEEREIETMLLWAVHQRYPSGEPERLVDAFERDLVRDQAAEVEST